MTNLSVLIVIAVTIISAAISAGLMLRLCVEAWKTRAQP